MEDKIAEENNAKDTNPKEEENEENNENEVKENIETPKEVVEDEEEIEETNSEESEQKEKNQSEDSTEEVKEEAKPPVENNNSINIKNEIVNNAKKSSKKLFYTIVLIVLIAIVIFYKQGITGNVVNNMESTTILLETTEGDITIELYEDMPITAGNFKNLVESKTYDGVIFHRIIDGFMIQGGDPTGTGMGDPSIPKIKDEFTNTDLDKNNRGTISMANAGPNTGSSQFFINLVDNNFLDGKHPVFGKVIQGMDIVDKIAKVETGAGDKPINEVKIISAKVI